MNRIHALISTSRVRDPIAMKQVAGDWRIVPLEHA